MDFIKNLWVNGQKLAAVIKLFNSLPQISLGFLFPSSFSEAQQTILVTKFGWQFTGPNAIPTWFRELWHFVGGFLITIPFVYWPPACFTIMFFICIYKGCDEFFGDASMHPDFKNLLDWFCWILGSFVASIISFLCFGPSIYK